MNIGWGQRRQLIVIAIFSLLGIAILATIAIAIFYRTPTCTDQKQNQDETGIDCGGPCSKACIADVRPASVSFARAIAPDVNRTDVIAYVENPNENAVARGVRAVVELYGADYVLLAKREVVFDLPGAATTPVFVEGLLSGNQAVAQTFFTVDQASIEWTRTTTQPVVPGVRDIVWQGGSQPRVSATLINPIAEPFSNVRLIATVFDSNDQAIAASRTVVAILPAQGTAPMVFTWNVPFASTPARVEVIPLIQVP